MACTESGRRGTSFKEATRLCGGIHRLYQDSQYLEDLVIGFGWGEDAAGATVVHYFGQSARFATLDLS